MEELQLHASQNSFRKEVYYLPNNRSLKITRLAETEESYLLSPSTSPGQVQWKEFV